MGFEPGDGYSLRLSDGFSLVTAAGVTAGLAGEMHAICIIGCDDRQGRPRDGVDIGGRISPTVRVGWGAHF